ncbi:MAG: hypothetical protein JST59_14300 [Actinobacteria bacterium]|nr:hypothetical protein [Actinomycetota bacterium]
MRHPFRIAMVVAALVATVGATVALANPGHGRPGGPPPGFHGSFSVGLFGDMPYGAAGREEYPRLIQNVNESNVAFSVFDGDLKAGGDGPCTDQLYTQSKTWFDSFTRPVVVTPGDNDWTDCWGRYGPGSGGYDPEERLEFERQTFFSTNQSLGGHTMTLERESAEPAFAAYSENARWSVGSVMFLTLNVQGSNDNLPHAGVDGETRPETEIARQAAEHQAREEANIHWLQESYALAGQRHMKGVMVVWQADPDFNNEYKLEPGQYDGFAQIVPALREAVIAFPGESVLVHGDSHYFKMDMPLNYDDGQTVTKFTRVETFGAANTHWVEATIDPFATPMFQFTPRIVPSNVDDR